MKKTLIAIENSKISEAYYTRKFIDSYKGKVIVLDLFHSRSKEEIVAAFKQATDIVVQTSLISGSDSQLGEMATVLANFKNPINIYIKYLRGNDTLYEAIEALLSLEKIYAISQHKIFDLEDWDVVENERVFNAKELDFEPLLKPLLKQKASKAVRNLAVENYKQTARYKTTGRKIKILACTAFGKAFENLPIGETVDEIDASGLCKGAPRGVWIWGNGEPIMLVNDSYPKEYEIVTKMTQEQLIKEICLQVSLPFENLTYLQHQEMKVVTEDLEDSVETKANSICELLEVEKRKNRANIRQLLMQHN